MADNTSLTSQTPANVDMSEISAAPTPVLTLTPDQEDPVLVAVSEESKALDVVKDDILSEEEKTMVNELAKQIDVRDTNMIMQYGSAAQKKMADFTDSTLATVRTKDLGNTGELLTSVLAELKGFDAEEEKGLFGFFKKNANKLELMKSRYDKVETNVNKIAKTLEEDQVQLLKDSAMLDKMYELNLTYFKELTMYIIAGKKHLEDIKNGELAELKAKADASGRMEDAQAVRDLNDMINRFERKLYDLSLTRQISLQTAPQIRFVQSGEIAMIEKIQTTLTSTIPLWKSQMVIAIGNENTANALKAQRAVTDATNELLQKNAEALETSTIGIAKETERGIVDMETLQKTNESLIRTFDEVLKIQEDGRRARAEAEVELQRLEGELKAKLLEAQSR